MHGTHPGGAASSPGSTHERVLARITDGLPLVSRPYSAVADELRLAEADVLSALRDLRAAHVIRRVSASFDASRLGYHATLGGLAVADDAVEAAAAALGTLPNVTHVFEVEDRYRLWFAVAVPALTHLEAAESEIAARTGCGDLYRVLPSELVKVTASFDADGAPDPFGPGRMSEGGAPLSRDEQALVRLLQGDLPMSERPFAALSATLEQCGYDVDERWALERLESFVTDGVVRQYGATRRSREEPWRLALAVWPAVAAPDAPAALVSSFPEVLHCYERRIPGDGASIISVLEVPDKAALGRAVERIRSAAALDDPRVLYPVREFKRVPMKYFTEGDR